MKRLAVLAVMVATALAIAAPVLAQESAAAVGTLEKPEATTYMYGTHAITDEASDTFYALRSEAVDLDSYTGQRVAVYGTLVPGYEYGQVEGGPPLVDVTSIEAAPL